MARKIVGVLPTSRFHIIALLRTSPPIFTTFLRHIKTPSYINAAQPVYTHLGSDVDWSGYCTLDILRGSTLELDSYVPAGPCIVDWVTPPSFTFTCNSCVLSVFLHASKKSTLLKVCHKTPALSHDEPNTGDRHSLVRIREELRSRQALRVVIHQRPNKPS